MVIFEAARAICNLKDVTTRELTPAVTLLQLFLSSNKPVVRFAAVRTLNKVSAACRCPVITLDHHVVHNLVGTSSNDIITPQGR